MLAKIEADLATAGPHPPHDTGYREFTLCVEDLSRRSGLPDSPLEQGGFEPPVPHTIDQAFVNSLLPLSRLCAEGSAEERPRPGGSWRARNVRRHLPVKGCAL